MESENSVLAYIATARRLPVSWARDQRTSWGGASDLPTLTTVRGVKYTPLWMAWPFLEPTYSEFEKTYNAAPAVVFLHKHAWAPLLSVALYLLLVLYGPRVMMDCKPFDLKGALAAWNLCLSLVSFVGALRMVSHLLFLLTPASGFGFRGLLCRSPEEAYGDNASGLWAVIFTISKVVELVDTVFVVLRKKPLIFLHWYHHATVLLVTWFGHITFTPGLIFMAMNYSIHAVMYMYFFLGAISRVPKWFDAKWLTMAQISQMFVGIYVTIMTNYYRFLTIDGCNVDDRMVAGFLVMYGSYFLLFLHFFLKRFITGSKIRTPVDGSTRKAQ